MALSKRQLKAIEVACGSKDDDAKVISKAVDAAQRASAVAVIPTPASATAEDCANKINEILTAMKAGGSATS